MTFLIPKNEFRKPNFAIFFFTTFLMDFSRIFCVKTNTIFIKIDQYDQNDEFEKNQKKFREIKKNFFREIEISWLLGKFQPHTSNHVTCFPL